MSKHDSVTSVLRTEIVTGRLPPGSRLPGQRRLAARFAVAGVTVQMAIKRLVREGFVVARRRSGVFVSDRPPHQTDYGMVFWNDPSAPLGALTWSRYFQALTQAALQLRCATGKQFILFHGIDYHTDVPDRQRLIERIETQRLAGIFFANMPFMLKETSILDRAGVPRLAFESVSPHPHVRSIEVVGWFEKSLDWLAGQGRKRVATIEHGFSRDSYDHLLSALAERGMETRSRWRQVAHHERRHTVSHQAELLMADRERPDALLVMDDNLAEGAQAGLAAAGVNVPDDVAVVCHANWPAPPAKILPVRLLGYDLLAMLRMAMDMMDGWRAGKMPPTVTALPALWEDEVETASRSPVARMCESVSALSGMNESGDDRLTITGDDYGTRWGKTSASRRHEITRS